MWSSRYIDIDLDNCTFLIFIILGSFSLEICRISLKYSLLFNTSSSLNDNIESFQTI